MAKPWLHHHNKPNRYEGLGVGTVEAGGVEEEKGTGGEGGEVKERPSHNTSSPPTEPAAEREQANRPEGRVIQLKTEERRLSRRPRGQTLEEEGTERPHRGPRLRALAWGGLPPPRGIRGPPGIHP